MLSSDILALDVGFTLPRNDASALLFNSILDAQFSLLPALCIPCLWDQYDTEPGAKKASGYKYVSVLLTRIQSIRPHLTLIRRASHPPFGLIIWLAVHWLSGLSLSRASLTVWLCSLFFPAVSSWRERWRDSKKLNQIWLTRSGQWLHKIVARFLWPWRLLPLLQLQACGTILACLQGESQEQEIKLPMADWQRFPIFSLFLFQDHSLSHSAL